MNPTWLAPLGNLAVIFLAAVVIPVLLFLLKFAWNIHPKIIAASKDLNDIKTNDLPHIYAELQALNKRPYPPATITDPASQLDWNID